MSQRRKKVLIATLPPEFTGGVRTLTTFLYQALEETGEFDVKLIYYIPWIKEPTYSVALLDILPSLLKLRIKKVGYEDGITCGMKARKVGTFLPEFEFTHYLLNKYWREEIAQSDILQVVSGANLVGFPFYQTKKRYLVWAATPYKEDRADKVPHYGLAKYLLDKISTPICRVQERLTYRHAAKIFALSEYTACKVSEQNSIDSKNILVVPYPIDVAKFRPSNVPPDNDVILCVGRINDPRKNILMLLKAFRIALDKGVFAKLALVGQPPNNTILDVVKNLNIQHAVIFTGKVSEKELVLLYQKAFFSVLPSNQEGLGIVVLESMGCGCPVIATRCGGPEMIIKDSENGFLVPKGNPYELAARMIELLKNPSLRAELSSKARATIVNDYSREKVIECFLNSYRIIYPDLFS